jgi:hypothetical protein
VTTYKEIQGISVQTVAGDPPAPLEGQIWYNSSTGTFRAYKESASGAWSTGGNLNRGREGLTGTGTQTAALATGRDPGGFVGSQEVEEYNGTSWTEVNDLPQATGYAGQFGIQTAAIISGGDSPSIVNDVFSYNGTNWTTVNSLNTAKGRHNGAGTQTSGLVTGGRTAPTTRTAQTETWNGTNWTEVNDLNTARQTRGVCGTQTAALAFGGFAPPSIDSTESWNGTSWTAVASMPSARSSHYGAGTQTSALSIGGSPTNTELILYNGTAWSSLADLSNPMYRHGGGGDSTSAISFGGNPSTNITEEFNAPVVATETITEV